MNAPTRDELEAHHCWIPGTDRVAGQPDVTAFRQRARLHQALWREARGLPIGSNPMRPKPGGRPGMPLGSRIDLDVAIATGANFLSASARTAAEQRLANPQAHQTLNPQRLWGDLLSSMPMCFNLFGPLAVDPVLAASAASAWFPNVPTGPTSVRLEWSPGRCDPAYLDNRTAFDAAIEIDQGSGAAAIIGIETKYHEAAVAERAPSAQRMVRYTEVTDRSGVFVPGAVEKIVGTDLQQIWLDHLLVLSMLQHPSERWTEGKYMLGHPAENPSFARLAGRYRELLADESTFEARTLESLIDAAGPLPTDLSSDLRDRYLW